MQRDDAGPGEPPVLHVVYSGLGGVGSVLISLIEGGLPNLHSTRVLFYGVEPVKPEYLSLCQARDVPAAYVRKRVGLDVRAWMMALRVMMSDSPAAIVLHSPTLLPVALIYGLLRRRRVFVVWHTPVAILRPVDWHLMRMAMLAASGNVVLTQSYLEAVERRLGRWFRRRKTVIIRNGINTARYVPKPRSNEEPGSLLLAMQARLAPSKDPETLLRALLLLRERRPDLSLRLVLAGDGDQLERVKRLVEELGLQEIVALPGTLDEAGVIDLLQRTDIYVHSTRAETMSTAVMQALGTGLPVVGTDVPGVNDLIVDGQTGVLFAVGEVPALAAAIEALADDQVERQRLGHNARQDAVRRLSHVVMAEAYAQLAS